jgi:octaprenyl-diphosphate synthase
LREGKPTLPLIYLLQNGSAEERDLVRTCIQNGDADHFHAILEALKSSGAFEYTRHKAEQAAQRAAASIACLRHSHSKDSLLQLCDFAVARTS